MSFRSLIAYLQFSGNLVYMCLCGNGLTSEELLISSNFRGIYGAAALFHHIKNVTYGRAEPRDMLTGRHIVRSINCLRKGDVHIHESFKVMKTSL